MADECTLGDAEVRQIVKNHLEGTLHEIIDYEIKNASDTPLGFLGDHVKITVNALVNGQDKVLKYFAKKMITKNEQHRNYTEGVKAFYKEIEHYKTLFADLKDAVSPGRWEKIKWRPECYFTRDYDFIVVEDLTPQGFYMLPERTLMSMDYLKAVLRVVACMHANSIIFEEKLQTGACKTRSPHYSPGKGKQLIGDLYPNLIFETECSDITQDHPGHRFWKAGIKSQVAVIEALENYTAEQKEKITKKWLEVAPTIFRMVEPSKKFRNVMCHGDLWGNNILFLDGEDGKVAKAITVDFQTTRYAPPAFDFYVFLHLMQDTPFRAKYENTLKDYFYQALTKELEVEGVNIDNILPIKDWEESCKFYKRYAILGQFIYTQVNYVSTELQEQFFGKPENFTQLYYIDRSDLLRESIKTDEVARARIFEAMEEVIREFNMI